MYEKHTVVCGQTDGRRKDWISLKYDGLKYILCVFKAWLVNAYISNTETLQTGPSFQDSTWHYSRLPRGGFLDGCTILFLTCRSDLYFGDLLCTWMCRSERRGTAGSVSVIIKWHSAILVSSMTMIYACAARLLRPGQWCVEVGTLHCFLWLYLH